MFRVLRGNLVQTVCLLRFWWFRLRANRVSPGCWRLLLWVRPKGISAFAPVFWIGTSWTLRIALSFLPVVAWFSTSPDWRLSSSIIPRRSSRPEWATSLASTWLWHSSWVPSIIVYFLNLSCDTTAISSWRFRTALLTAKTLLRLWAISETSWEVGIFSSITISEHILVWCIIRSFCPSIYPIMLAIIVTRPRSWIRIWWARFPATKVFPVSELSLSWIRARTAFLYPFSTTIFTLVPSVNKIPVTPMPVKLFESAQSWFSTPILISWSVWISAAIIPQADSSLISSIRAVSTCWSSTHFSGVIGGIFEIPSITSSFFGPGLWIPFLVLRMNISSSLIVV